MRNNPHTGNEKDNLEPVSCLYPNRISLNRISLLLRVPDRFEWSTLGCYLPLLIIHHKSYAILTLHLFLHKTVQRLPEVRGLLDLN